MKTISILGLLSMCSVLGAQTVNQADPAANPSTVPAPTPYAVVSQDANSAVWQGETYEQAPDGSIVTNMHQYTELATGLNHLVNGQWVASSEEITISPDGSSASATNGQHQVYFPGDIYNGEIELVTPDGKTLESQPIGLSYFDGSNSVLLAVVTNSTGAILPSGNQVIYTNAFTGLNADLLYTYTRAGFEQDVILRAQPPYPAFLGLNPQTTRLQVLTEFSNPQQPNVTTATVPTAAGNLEDDSLSFGMMQMGHGKAFLLGTNSPSVGVNKQWLMLEGRQFLVEEVPLASIANELSQLPVSQTVSTSPNPPLNVVSIKRLLPAQRLVALPKRHSMNLAQNAPLSKGLVLDYTINGYITNFTFQGNTTYFVSSWVELYGTNTFEGGAVIKYTNNANISLVSPSETIWLGSAYRPVIFTSKDDNSVGDGISGSTGSPSGYYASFALDLWGGNATLNYVRIAYAQEAIQFNSGANLTLCNAQIVDCGDGLNWDYSGGSATVENALFANVGNAFNLSGLVNSNTISAQNVTFVTNANLIVPSSFSSYFYPYSPIIILTNCILADVTTCGFYISGANNGAYGLTWSVPGGITSSQYPFQSVGAGNFYLTNGCTFTNAGTINIDPALLAELQHETTCPPLLLTNQTVSVNTNLVPQAHRDTESPGPDLGYHYDPIDYIADEFAITNAGLTVTNGAAIASYNETGIQLQDGSSILSIGTPLYPNWFVRYSSVQEQPMVLGGTNLTIGLTVSALHYGNVGPTGQYRFSKFACPAGCGYLFNDAGASSYSGLLVKDAELYSGFSYFGGYSNTVTALLNNLFDRSYLYAYDNAAQNSLSVSNNLVFGTTVYLFNWSGANIWQAFNNAFDTCVIYYAPYPPIGKLTNGYNAYLNCSGYSGQMGQLYPTNLFDIVTNASLAYQTGPLGNFYQPTNSPLINMGSTNANLVGLYHYTVTTNQVVEGDNIVSIGYHYVAVDQYGNPLDSNGDGIPDYLEDANGDGIYDTGDLGDWQGLNLNVIITRPRSGNILP